VNARESFGGLLLAEWTKLRSVTRWVITLLGAAAITIGLSALAATASTWDAQAQARFLSGPLGDPVADDFYFVHQQVTGDTTLTVRVASLAPEPGPKEVDDGSEKMTRVDDPSPFAQPAAGIMIKDGTRSGSSYASLMLTATQGVRMQWDFAEDRPGTVAGGGRWLRLVRSGDTITGYESADGVSWRPVASATPANLPSTVEVGFYVSSPPAMYVSRGGGSSSAGQEPTKITATFDHVQLDSSGQWKGEVIGHPIVKERAEAPERSELNLSDGTYTVQGNGLIGPNAPPDDIVAAALIGVIAGLMALIAVGVLYATSEYRRGMIRTTLAATPRRGRIVAAKAVVLGGTSFLVGLVGAVGSFLLAIPVLRSHNYVAPAFPKPTLTDPAVLRALLLTAAFMAGVALVGMGIGMLLKHSAAAITITIVLVVLPLIVGMILPGSTPKWLMYTTLAGGLAAQRAKPPTMALAEPWAMIGPWAGIGAVAAWAAIALGLAWWQLRRRDA
jgi:ABC-type transport system involved in multi-copper enzyme maturation permease subunit